MDEFLLGAGLVVLFTVAAGLWRLLRGPSAVDRIMALQLLGSGGVAVLLLASGAGLEAAVDVALTMALLACFAAVAFVRCRSGEEGGEEL